jgi:hypothetical protein
MPNLEVTGPTNLLTTVEDLALWDHNFVAKTVGGDAALSLMRTPAGPGPGGGVAYGLGLQITKYGGLNVLEHDGRDAGYRSHLIRFPDQDFAVACLCNLAGPKNYLPLTHRTHGLVRQIANIYLANLFTEPAVDHDPSDLTFARSSSTAGLEQYLGTYYNADIDATYQIVLKDSSLLVKRPRYFDAPLVRAHDETFWFQGFGRPFEGFGRPLTTAQIRFRPAHDSDKIISFVLTGQRDGQTRIRDIEFTKMP